MNVIGTIINVGPMDFAYTALYSNGPSPASGTITKNRGSIGFNANPARPIVVKLTPVSAGQEESATQDETASAIDNAIGIAIVNGSQEALLYYTSSIGQKGSLKPGRSFLFTSETNLSINVSTSPISEGV